MTMPDWPKVWAREPGLRPAGVNGDRLRVNPDYPANFEWHHECEDPCCQARPESRRAVWIDDVEALCRDAAVRWLLARTVFVVPSNLPSEPACWSWYSWTDTEPRHLGDSHDSFDAALYAAVDKVLTAEGK